MKKLLGIVLSLAVVIGLVITVTAPVAADSPTVYVGFNTNLSSSVAGDSFTNGPVTGKESWVGALGGASQPFDLTLNLAGSAAFDSVSANPPSVIPAITGDNYQWYFPNTQSNAGATVGMNNSSVTFTPGFDASRSVSQSTFNIGGVKSHKSSL